MESACDRTGSRLGHLLRLLEWPRSAWLFCGLVSMLYLPALQQAVGMWLGDESYSHGVFILPVTLALLYCLRERIREAAIRPVARGLLPLFAGLFVYAAAYLMQVNLLLLWTAIPVLWGGVLVLHGPELWKIVRFPVLYIAFAAQVPFLFLQGLNLWIKNASTTGAAETMKVLGYTLLQTGNQIEIPGYSLEVADVCSGYKKLVALVAFAVLYGYVFTAAPWKRILLVAAAVPVAVLSNIVRVSGLIAVTSAGGLPALKMAHDWAEIVALGLAFLLFVWIGKVLGCKTVRFSQPSAS